MNGTQKSAEETLPYGSAATFVTTLDHLREVGVPNVIDRTTLPQSFSGSSRYEVLGTLKFFKLIDKDGKPDIAALEPLLAEGTRREAMAKLLERFYPTLFALPLAKAAPGQVQRWFSDHATASTVGKAKSFFLAIAKQSGVEMHSMVAKGARVVAGSVKRKRRNKPPKPPTGDNDKDDDTPDDAPPSRGTTRTVALRSGAGDLTIRISVDLWDLVSPDREFVFSMMDALRIYDQGGEVALVVKKGDFKFPGAAES